MPDDKEIRHPHDSKRIDIKDPSEVRNWCRSLGCTKSELKAAVKAVGTSASKVREYLQAAGMSAFEVHRRRAKQRLKRVKGG